MGVWDIFCFLCGNTCHNSYYDVENLLESVDYYEKNKREKYLNYFIPIYEEYKKNPDKIKNKVNEVFKKTNWLNKCTFLCANNKVVHGCSEIFGNITFEDNKKNRYINLTYSENPNIMYGLFVHTDCWKFIKKQYKIELKYSYIPITNFDIIDPEIFNFIDYGVIQKYWDQEFNFLQMIIDNNYKLCYSPEESKATTKNIKKIFTKIKSQIRNEGKRQSPPISATFYNEGIYKVGNNGNIWTIKSGKWIELKNTIKKTVSEVQKIVYCGDVNIKPIFVLKKVKNGFEVLTLKT